MGALRLITVVLVFAIIAVAAVPALVLIDLVGGGDGWGLCPTGVDSCNSSYFDGPELLAILTVALFALVALLRISFLLRRRIERRRTRNALAAASRTAEPETP